MEKEKNGTSELYTQSNCTQQFHTFFSSLKNLVSSTINCQTTPCAPHLHTLVVVVLYQS